MPSATAASAHPITKPYTGAFRVQVTAIPSAVANATETCPNRATYFGLLDIEATEPFRFTNVAAVVQPKCSDVGKP